MAAPGDTIVLEPGGRYVGQFRFPAKAGRVTLTTSAPLPDRRITPADAPLLPTIVSGTAMMAVDMYDATNWTLDGIRFEANTGGYGELIGIQRGSHIVLRRLLIDVPSGQEQKRFVLGNGQHITLTQSWCSGIWRTGQDSQCFVAWDGAGPYTITDNFLEAASENVMFGGADSLTPGNVPADILVEGNWFTKRLEWKGFPRVVKNLFELKAARRVVVRSNVFERNWVDAQSGTAIVFTPRNQSGGAPWTVVEDVLFEYNVVRDTPSHFNILGFDNLAPSQQTTRITIRQNLLLGDGGGRLATLGNEIGDLVFDHNTYLNVPTNGSMITMYAEGSIATASGARGAQFAVRSFTFTNNYVHQNAYGLHSSIGFGLTTLSGMTLGSAWAGNVVGGGHAAWYPAGTATPADADFHAQLDGSYYLLPTSVYASMATDGTDIGWTRPAAAPVAAPAPAPAPDPTATSAPAPDPTPAPAPDPTSTSAPAPDPTSAPAPAPDPTPAPAPAPTAPTLTLSIATATLPDGVRRQKYSAPLAASDAAGKVTWALTSGALPQGLTLDKTRGVISGTCRKDGTFTFAVTASDTVADATAQFTITVHAK